MLNFVGRLLLLAGLFSGLGLQAVAEIPRVSEVQRPATTVKEWMAQVEATTVRVTNVRVERTDSGLDITLETAEGKPLQVDATKFRSEGKSLIADIPNAVLTLPETQAFSADNPTEEVATVRVTQLDANNIRVSVTGNNALPRSEVTLKTGALAYNLNPEGEAPEEELVVTGEGQQGYRVPDATTATKTDTPLRDIPFSIQVVPQEVFRDQQGTRLNDALRNVPGVITTSGTPGNSEDSSFTIRGFESGTTLRNGLADTLGTLSLELSNIERVEVLKGPASALFGSGSIGGTINLITKQPLLNPYYAVASTVGNYSYYRGAVDLSGPLNDAKTALYRLNLSYKDTSSFIDFSHDRHLLIAPVLSFAIGERTKLTLEGEYIDADTNRLSLPAAGTVLPNPNGKIARNLNISGPDKNDNNVHQPIGRIGYTLEHKFNDNWSLKNAFRATLYHFDINIYAASSLDPDQRTLNRRFTDSLIDYQTYNLTTDIVGKFSTGSIQHQLVFGFDLSRIDSEFSVTRNNAASIDLFNPVYDQSLGASLSPLNASSLTEALGIYIQDQIALSQNLKLLLGGRFDAFKQTDGDLIANTKSSQSGDAFSPRFGIVYQPIQPISLYASYSRSFNPAIGTSFNGDLFKPERATQYEVGVKANLSERISTTLAFYNLTRSNVLTQDPINQDFSIQTGEQRSRGIEFNIVGEILPGWKVIAGYAYTDATITKDNTYTPGNRLNNVPKNSFNLWTKYEIQSGSLKGLGFGLGFFYVGDYQGDVDNSFEVPSYFRTDAAIFYKRGRFRTQLNIRNLFDVDYFESARSVLSVYPGAPFTVQGTISWEF